MNRHKIISFTQLDLNLNSFRTERIDFNYLAQMFLFFFIFIIKLSQFTAVITWVKKTI